MNTEKTERGNRSQIMLKKEGKVNVKCCINVKEVEGQKQFAIEHSVPLAGAVSIIFKWKKMGTGHVDSVSGNLA